MKVSVVVPVYNEQKYIRALLESLMLQEVKADEVIIVNNNSKDDTVKIARSYPVRVITEKKQGIIPARNLGYDTAVSDIIARTDADVVLDPGWIKKIKHNFNKYKIDALTGPVIFYDFPHKTPSYASFYFEFLQKLQKGKDTLIGPNMAITRKIWRQVRADLCTDDKKVHEDQDLGIHIAQAGGKIRVDHTMVNHASARRLLHNPRSFFIEYPTRLVKTHQSHFTS